MTRYRLPHYLTTIAALLFALGAPAAPAIFPLKDVREGLRGVGRTVFQGDKVEEFQVEILGVLENAGPKQSIILARVSGGPLERTGVMQGMSGSPVYIDGKLVGALAMAFPFSKEPIAGIRPIEEMIRSTGNGGGVARADGAVQLADKSLTAHFPKRQPAGDAKLTDIMTPMSFSGFTRNTLETFGPQLRSLGLEPQQGLSGGSTATVKRQNNAPLEPGSMISVQMITGDMSVGADGTVTLIDGKKIYAFGHRFMALGDADMPFARSNVVTLLPNLQSSFKISTSGDFLGSITSDNNAAIAGELGRKPKMVPLRISVKGGVPSQYNMEMVSDSLLSPLLLQMAVYSTLDSTERTLGKGSIGVRGKLEFDGLPSVDVSNMFAGDFNVPLQAALSTALPLAYALQNNTDGLKLKSASLELDSFPDKRQLQIDQVWASRREVRPGEDFSITALLSGENGKEIRREVKYQVPVGAPTGPLYITVGDGTTTNVADYAQFSLTQPRTGDQIVTFLNRLRGNNRAYVRLWRSDPVFQVQGQDLVNAPASLTMVLAKAQGAYGTNTPRSAKVAEFDMPVENGFVVSGAKTIQVDIKE